MYLEKLDSCSFVYSQTPRLKVNNHEHEIKYLSDLDRRKFLKVSGAFTGLAVLTSILDADLAYGASTVKLPGFSAFSNSVKVFKSGKYYLVESSGIPDHQMMVGIKSWQQQVPTVQPYVGTNAWSIPITPVISQSPISTKGHFLRGAIGLAVNGVPIFNALNNRGDDALLAGELDDWGGHCGRADDYHYHVAPLHLKSIVGTKTPSHMHLMVFQSMAKSSQMERKLSILTNSTATSIQRRSITTTVLKPIHISMADFAESFAR